MSPQIWWYVARASGIVAWLMLTASVLWGVLLSTPAFPSRRRPAWLLDLHRWLGGLTMSFVVLHIGALIADSYVSFDVIDVLVPFAADWERGAVALGVIAAWLLVAVEITSIARRRLPRRAWRAIHMSSYGAFWLTSLHAAFAGTDRHSLLYVAPAVVSLVLVGWATMYRIASRGRRRSGRRDGVDPPAIRVRDDAAGAWSAPVGADHEVAVGVAREEPRPRLGSRALVEVER